MPFTPSHAVIALPFVRTPLVPAAIAIGAMTPDLPLFVRATPLTYDITHTNAWIPVTALVAFVLFLVWRCVLRPAVRELAPACVARRLPDEWDASAAASAREAVTGGAGRGAGRSYPVLLAASLVIGVISHILWDLFTHEGRWGTEVLPVLDEYWGPLTGYKWLQHGSSALGLLILAIFAIQWVRRADAASLVTRVLPSWVRWAWWISLPALLIAALAVGIALRGPLTAEWTINHLSYFVLPPACAIWGVVTVVLAVAVQAARASRPADVREGSEPDSGIGAPRARRGERGR